MKRVLSCLVFLVSVNCQAWTEVESASGNLKGLRCSADMDEIAEVFSFSEFFGGWQLVESIQKEFETWATQFGNSKNTIFESLEQVPHAKLALSVVIPMEGGEYEQGFMELSLFYGGLAGMNSLSARSPVAHSSFDPKKAEANTFQICYRGSEEQPEIFWRIRENAQANWQYIAVRVAGDEEPELHLGLNAMAEDGSFLSDASPQTYIPFEPHEKCAERLTGGMF